MTVWTNVTLDDLNKWMAAGKLGTAAKIIPLEEGSEDSLFQVILNEGNKYCLRLFERTEPERPSIIANHLAALGLPTSPPVRDSSGRFVRLLNGKPAALYPWIEGSWPAKPSIKQVETIGAFIGRLGKESQRYGDEWTRENPRGWEWFRKTTGEVEKSLSFVERKEITSELAKQFDYWDSERITKLPVGLIHGDLFRDNALFDAEEHLLAVIDWGFCACPFPLVFDLAITANDWCLRDGSSELDQERLAALLSGRNKEFPITEAEQEVWPMALRWAALRFYLSRLYDFYFPRIGGKKLDPGHFRKILRARQSM